MTELKSTGRQFVSAPVYETALSFQFQELDGFRTVHFGRFHERIRSVYPVAEDHPRADRIVEVFPKPLHARIKLVHQEAGPERVWYRDDEDGTHLLQLQPDRFALNWRKSSESDAYPSFVTNGNMFLDEFRKFEQFCREEGLGRVRIDLCEVAYVNRILPNPNESAVHCFQDIFSGVAWDETEQFLPAPEYVTLNRVYPIQEHRGRLYAEASTLQHPEHGEMILLKLTARIKCGQEFEDAVQSLQLAHDWVVNGFVALTKPHARKNRWKERT
ncbi:TIGR04255 family protein [Maioricimonas sp. JC845]|uniref:TIGR04255 family protein n=1 Tax=Maioricimonas sp. JC845 TaxID=3232138 RepID=UPI00345A7588